MVFTQDADFLRLHSAGLPHAGIVFAAQAMAVGDVIRGLMLVPRLLSAEEMEDHVEFL